MQNWIEQPLRAGKHFNAGDANIDLVNLDLAWRFDLSKPESGAHRVEFSWGKYPDSNSGDYSYTGKFLVPKWVNFDPGRAVIMQWHEKDGGDLFLLNIDNASIEVVSYRNKDRMVLLHSPLIRNEWNTISGEYNWSTHHTGSVNGEVFEYLGDFKNMYWKYGVYRTGHNGLLYSDVQVWWRDVLKTRAEALSV